MLKSQLSSGTCLGRLVNPLSVCRVAVIPLVVFFPSVAFTRYKCVPESSRGSISSAYQVSGNITRHLVSIKTSLLFRYFSSMASPLICFFNNLWSTGVSFVSDNNSLCFSMCSVKAFVFRISA